MISTACKDRFSPFRILSSRTVEERGASSRVIGKMRTTSVVLWGLWPIKDNWTDCHSPTPIGESESGE
jgi:hypothetical protein